MYTQRPTNRIVGEHKESFGSKAIERVRWIRMHVDNFNVPHVQIHGGNVAVNCQQLVFGNFELAKSEIVVRSAPYEKK